MELWLILGAVVVVVAIAIISSHTVRGWLKKVFLDNAWFKDSEVNLGADLSFVLGFLAMIINDPSYTALFTALHISPETLMAIGLIFRFLKALRNKGALPFTRTSDD